MKALHILMCLALSLLGSGLKAQIPGSIDPDLRGLPQVFSPNAAELGKYGKVPVNYFNGLPNINIPLTELKAKGYTLPVYLTYHASGNKPDQHPGWVGLGWTLHAGGCINRIVNGMKDEMTRGEYEFLYGGHGEPLPEIHPGYYYISESVQSTDWSDYPTVTDTIDYYIRDRDPDEFQICLDDIQASFYIYGPNEVRVVSKTDVDIKVDLNMATEGMDNPLVVYPSNTPGIESKAARRYHYFDKIVVTSKDGTRYVFGGDDDAIEYSMHLIPSFAYTGGTLPDNIDVWKCSATANTWHLTKIERPDGEEVLLSYAKDGTPVVRQDVHHAEYYYIDTINLPGYRYDTKLSPSLLSNLSFSLIHPSYLTGISCKLSSDALIFNRMRTTELIYPTTDEEFYMRAGQYDESSPGGTMFTYSDIMSEDYYMQLSSITGQNRDIRFLYSSDSGRRLTLYQVCFMQGENSDRKFVLEYNPTRLPNYHSREIDLWGFYNGIYFGGAQDQNQEDIRRTVDSEKCQAEILTKIHYPTGGRTEFFYEGHTYSSEMKQLPMALVHRSTILHAGGVRVSMIRDVSSDGKVEERNYDYHSGELSSGILAGMPRLLINQGKHHVEYVVSGLPWNFPDSTVSYDAFYYLYSESPIRPLSTTDGSHVTYSKIREIRADGSASIYEYNNHHTASGQDTEPMRLSTCDSLFAIIPFNSRELLRGLLLKRTDLSASGDTIRIEENRYNIDTTTFMKALSRDSACGERVRSYSYHRILTGFPYLMEKVETIFDDNGNSHVESTDYVYDSHRNLTEMSRTSGGGTEVDLFTYPGNYPYSPMYSAISASGRHASPVEHIHSVNGVVSEAELTTWRQGGAPGDFVPAELYQATPTNIPDFNALYDGTNIDAAYGPPRVRYLDYDEHSNLLRSATPDGVETTYTWDKDSTHLRGVFMGAGRKTRYRIWSELARVTEQENLSLIHDRYHVGSFTSVADGTVTVNIWFDAGDERDIWGKIDSLNFHCPCPTIVGGMSPIYSITFQLEAGHHTLLLSTSDGVFPPIVPVLPAPGSGTGGNVPVSDLGEIPSDPTEPVIIIDPNGTPLRGYMSLTYWGDPDYVHVRDEQECAHYSFEGTGDNPNGFESERSQQSAVTVHLILNPDLTYTLDRRVMRNGKWVYERIPFEVNTSDLYELYAGGSPFDEVRIYADSVQPETFTWWPDGNLRSRSDARGITESYEYDGLGRLICVYDNERKKVEEYMYNYQNK